MLICYCLKVSKISGIDKIKLANGILVVLIYRISEEFYFKKLIIVIVILAWESNGKNSGGNIRDVFDVLLENFYVR